MEWLALGLGALIVGISKTSIGGLSVLAVMSFALTMPAKESTGAVLLIYLFGDLVATTRFFHDCNWKLLRELLPWVIPGVALGAWFLTLVDSIALKRWIAIILILSVLVHLVLDARRERTSQLQGAAKHLSAGVAGIGAGFTTMTANAGAPVMTLYLLILKVDKQVFVGTAAWFFFLVNLTKLPFSIGVGAVTWDVFKQVIWLAPVVWFGCWLGLKVLRWIPQRLFNTLALLASALAAVTLLLA